jgi:hypothetical protein
MQRRFHNIIVLLSILAFLATSAVNTFGFAWCIDEDGSTRVEKASLSGCADLQGKCQPLDPYGPARISALDSEHSAPCTDVLIETDEFVVSKRIVKPHKLPLVDNVQPIFLNTPASKAPHFVSVLSPQRVSMAILAHRTVVLLI